MRNIACSDCVVTTLLGPVDAVAEHHDMFSVLAQAGLTRPLRLIPGHNDDESEQSLTG